MTEREQFDAWACANQTVDGYPTSTPWGAWQASRRAALEYAIAKLEGDYVKAALSPVTVLGCIDVLRELSKG
jgi:hypothetical protein